MTDTFVPLSVREGGVISKLDWWWKGRREALALRLAPWLLSRRETYIARDLSRWPVGPVHESLARRAYEIAREPYGPWEKAPEVTRRLWLEIAQELSSDSQWKRFYVQVCEQRNAAQARVRELEARDERPPNRLLAEDYLRTEENT